MNNQNYQMWLSDRQKEILLEYIKDRRYKFMISMQITLLISIFFTLYLQYEKIIQGFSYHNILDHSEMLIYWLVSVAIFISIFFKGICKIFWKNSDYDCLKHDSYTLDFLECTGKLPDSGNYPYFIKCADGNIYQCGMKFLEWKNFPLGEMLVCVTLRNGQKYALLPEKQF